MMPAPMCHRTLVSLLLLLFYCCSETATAMRRRPPPPTSSASRVPPPVDQPMDRIHRGWYLDEHEFPWMVKIKAYFPPPPRRAGDFFGGNSVPPQSNCGGALITPEWVISARHCVTWHPPGRRGIGVQNGPAAVEVKAFVGSHDNYGEDGQAVAVVEAVGHEDYGMPQCNSRDEDEGDCSGNRGGGLFAFLLPPQRRMDAVFTNDIVLLRLAHPVAMTPKVHPLRLPRWNKDYMGAQTFVAGWGRQTRRREDDEGRSLKAAEMRVIPSESSPTCWDQAGNGKMCAAPAAESPREGSVCPGDSGSPLVVWDEGGWTLAGLLSNGAKDCFASMPAVFTRVGDYLDWIHEAIDDTAVP